MKRNDGDDDGLGIYYDRGSVPPPLLSSVFIDDDDARRSVARRWRRCGGLSCVHYICRAPQFCRRSVYTPGGACPLSPPVRNVVLASGSPVNAYYYCIYIYIYLFIQYTYVHTCARVYVCTCLYFLSPCIPVHFPIRRWKRRHCQDRLFPITYTALHYHFKLLQKLPVPPVTHITIDDIILNLFIIIRLIAALRHAKRCDNARRPIFVLIMSTGSQPC